MSLIPERPRFLPETCDVIAKADVIVAGPGSLFTSILPPLLVPQVAAAIRRSDAVRVLVANLMTEPGETDDYSILEHLLTIERHLGAQLFDYVIYNTSAVPEHLGAAYAARHSYPIVTGTFELNALEKLGVEPIGVPLVSEHPAGKIRHHPERLGAAITALGQRQLEHGAAERRLEASDMYERFYELRERPFALSPDPDYLYPSRVHREALDYLRYGLESHAGFVVITGEIGSGKTTLLQTLLRGLDSQTTVGRIVNTMLEPRELLETIMIDFGLDPAGRSKPVMLRDLAEYPGRSAARRAADPAGHRRSPESQPRGARGAAHALEPRDREIEAAADRAGRAAEPARQAGGAGARAAAPADYGELPSQPLDAEETAKYINHRLRRASTGVPLEFPARRHRHRPQPQPWRAPDHQRHLRRYPRVRLR